MKNMSILTLFLAVFLISCQKGADGPLVPGPNNADSIYLEKLMVLDTTRPVGMDTVQKLFFQYDNAKRIKSIFSYVVGVMDTSKQEFFYQGNDTLPFKVVDHSVEDHGAGFFHYVDTLYFSYTSGVVRKDSVLSWNLTTGGFVGGPEVRDFTIGGNTVTRISKRYGLFSGNYILVDSDTANFDVTYNAGNLTTHTITSGREYGNVFVNATYDTKINPFARVFPVKYPLFGSYLAEDWLSQKNNPLHVQYRFDNLSSPLESEQFTYIYRNDNYPLIAIYPSIDGLEFNKLLYLYTAL